MLFLGWRLLASFPLITQPLTHCYAGKKKEKIISMISKRVVRMFHAPHFSVTILIFNYCFGNRHFIHSSPYSRFPFYGYRQTNKQTTVPLKSLPEQKWWRFICFFFLGFIFCRDKQGSWQNLTMFKKPSNILLSV